MKYSFLDTFNPEWAADRVIVLLLMCIALFNPACVGIGDAPAVVRANTKYTALLHMYGGRRARVCCTSTVPLTATSTRPYTPSLSQSMCGTR